MTTSELIDALGGPSAVARALSVPISTVHSWKTKGGIPRWRQDAVADLARSAGVDCDFAVPEPSAPTSEAA